MNRALWAVIAMFALVSISCAGGTNESSSDLPMAGTTAGASGVGGGGGAAGGASSCGDGRIDMLTNENCEPSIPHGLTCEGLGMGPGMIMCSSSCRLMMMCTTDPSPGGTGGGQNMAGTGG
jgi:hypothetical protein